MPTTHVGIATKTASVTSTQSVFHGAVGMLDRQHRQPDRTNGCAHGCVRTDGEELTLEIMDGGPVTGFVYAGIPLSLYGAATVRPS